jgi:flagellar hook assembly protein FlgD
LHFVLPAAGAVELTVFDVSGRRVRTLIAGPRPAGAGEISWDGRDETGHPVRAGLYLARLRTGAGARTGRLVRLD